MTHLVTGTSGFVGYALFKQLQKEGISSIGLAREAKDPNTYQIDITNKEQVDTFIKAQCPKVVYHAAANPNAEFCEENHKEAWLTNVEGTRNIAEACKAVGAKLVYISSEYVFDGMKGNYTEEDAPNPINYYGKTKLLGEEIVKSLVEDHLIIRTTVIYGWERRGKNYVFRLVKNLRDNKGMRAPIDQFSSPTFVEDLNNTIIKLVQHNKQGIFNVVGPEVMNRYDFSLQVAEAFNLNKDLIKPVTSNILRQKAPRPLMAGLDIRKIKKEVNAIMLPPRQALQIMRDSEITWQNT